MDLQDSRSNAPYAVAAGFLGWTLDAFDFFVVVLVLSAVAKNFGRSIPALALSQRQRLITVRKLVRRVGGLGSAPARPAVLPCGAVRNPQQAGGLYRCGAF